MKCLIVLLAVCGLAAANIPVLGGKSNTYRKQDVSLSHVWLVAKFPTYLNVLQDYGNYAFGYNIIDPYGATNSREEKGDANGNVVGSYSLTDIDGRARKVNYVADKLGFRAAIDTNEPGTGNSDPAAVVINGPDALTSGTTLREDGYIPPQYNQPLPLAAPAVVQTGPLLVQRGGPLLGALNVKIPSSLGLYDGKAKA